MHLHTFAIPGLYLTILGCAASPSLPTQAEAQRQVLATEAAFAKTMADRDHKAFSTFIADDAVFFAGDDPLRGKQQIVVWWEQYYAAPGAPFSWEPENVEILNSGTLAYSSGPVRDPEGNVIGHFNSIWRYDGADTWRIIFDKGSDDCNCTTD
jgi:ketosteroid isomerase-like protein